MQLNTKMKRRSETKITTLYKIESETMKGIVNKNPDNFRYALEEYHWEEYECMGYVLEHGNK